ncbi:MAG: M20 family metallopeptidase [Treponema sp.]|jgi:amidohydrolase|nr:M20 family metallopeptidase [Treponema sp.]
MQDVENLRDEILGLSRNIHENPELAFKEYKSAGFIKALLQKHGFTLEDKIGGLDTAFKGTFPGGKAGPTVALLAEYDALPEVGHGCGHNLISAVSLGAAIALSKNMKEIGGTLALIGTPAEERGGGKIILLEKGAFEGINYALMTHPSTTNMVNRGGLATTGVHLAFKGRAAHSASPENGINALQALIQTLNLLDAVRVQMPLKATTNAIITDGGTASNIIPEYARCEISVRAATIADLKKVLDMIKKIVSSVESLTGAEADYSTTLIYAERYSNLSIDRVFKKHLESLGETVQYPDPAAKVGSSDIGNVSLVMPAIHAYFKITDNRVNAHSKDFAAAAITDYAHEMTLKAAKALACTAYEIFTDGSLRGEIKKEFDEKVPRYKDVRNFQ